LLPQTSSEDLKKAKTRKIQQVVVALVVGLTLVAAGFELGMWKLVIDRVKCAWGELKGMGLAAIPVVVALCWAITTFSGPAFSIELAAGTLFQQMWPHHSKGKYIAISTCCLGIWLGCITAFALGRRYFKDMANKFIEKHETLKIVNEIIVNEGWKFAFLMRLNPLIPFELFNYAVAMTDIPAFYNAIAALGTMPIVAFEVYSGAIAAELAASATDKQGEGQSQKAEEVLIKLAISCALIVAVCVYGKSKYDAKVREKRAQVSTDAQSV